MARARGSKTGSRASWRGQIVIDLVVFSVEAFNAVRADEGEIHFNQLHAECNNRIRYQKVCPVHGPVERDEIVLGYEYEKNKYVVLDPSEVEKMRTSAERALRVEAFVAPEQIDPNYLDGRTYLLAPAESAAEEPYAVMQAALSEMNRYAVGQIVFSQREELVAVRPWKTALVMHMLRHQEQFRSLEDVDIPKIKIAPRKAQMAESLIKAATVNRFELGRYKDEYQKKLSALIEAKVKGKEIVAAEEEETPPVVNLMDALRRSLANKRSKPEPAAARRTTRANTTRAKSATRRKRAS
jgi:DNA end-binding protein Ku